MHEITPLSLPDLLIDTENPRLEQPNIGHREALRAFAQHEPGKLVTLAKDIVAHGINQSELPIVIRLEDDLKRYVVLEGNRRLSVLKALENPEWLVGAMSPSDVAVMRALSREYLEDPIESISCIVVPTREAAQHWIELRHTGGENGGASVVPWNADDAARFRARTGSFPIHTQALNLLEQAGQITPAKRRAIKSSNLKRLLGTPEVRSKLGLELQNGNLIVAGDQKQVLKSLLHVVNACESLKVEDIYTRDKRIAYANALPSISSKISTPTKSSAGQKSLANKVSRNSSPRDRLIPTKCALNITDARLQDIARELRKLSLTQRTNAISVLFRVFIELSADAYVERENIAGSVDDKLSVKLLAVTTDLISRRKLTKQQAAPVRLICNKDSFLAPSTGLVNEYVHSKFIFPVAIDLRSYTPPMPFYTPLRYPGGKRRLAATVMRLLDANGLRDITYCETYAGGAAVALALLMEEYASTIHINDLNRAVYAFWHTLLNHTDAFCKRIEKTKITMAEWERQRAIYDGRETADLAELGFATLFLNRTNRSGILSGGVIGGKAQTGKWGIDARFGKPELISRVRKIGRYKSRINLYQLDALQFTNDVVPHLGGNRFVFYDPPYIDNGADLYLNNYDLAGHKQLAKVISRLPGAWIVTYDYAAVTHGLYRSHRRLVYGLNSAAKDRYEGREVMFLAKRLKTPLGWKKSKPIAMSAEGSEYPLFGILEGAK